MLTLHTPKRVTFNTIMKNLKCIKVYVGTDIVMTAPSHPLSIAIQIKRVVDRILILEDKDFEYSVNSREAIDVFQHYGQDAHPNDILVIFFLNGKKAKYEEVIEDLERGKKYVEQLISNNK